MASYLNRSNSGAANGAETTPNATQQLANMINQFKGVNNPQALIMQMGQKNPQALQKFQSLMQSGGDPQKIAQQLMKQKGIDLNQRMSMIK